MLRCVCYVNTHADANVDCKADTILSFSFYLCLIVLCYSECVMLRRAVRVRMRTDWFDDAHMPASTSAFSLKAARTRRLIAQLMMEGTRAGPAAISP